jgi:hypothetical protein
MVKSFEIFMRYLLYVNGVKVSKRQHAFAEPQTKHVLVLGATAIANTGTVCRPQN